MSFARLLKENSALASALDLVGDKWTLMILSGCLSSVCRFNELESALGINRNILSARLDKLIASGMIEKREYQTKPARYEYVITDIGRELRPVLVGLAAWAENHITKDECPVSMVHQTCGTKAQIQIYCESCDQVVPVDDVSSKLNPNAGSESVKVYNESRNHFFHLK